MTVPIEWKAVLAAGARRRRIAQWVLLALLSYTLVTTVLLILAVELGLDYRTLLYLCPMTFVFTPLALKPYAAILSALFAVLPLLGWVLMVRKRSFGRYFVLIVYGIVLTLLAVVTLMFCVLSLRIWWGEYFAMTLYYALCTAIVSILTLAALHFFQPKIH